MILEKHFLNVKMAISNLLLLGITNVILAKFLQSQIIQFVILLMPTSMPKQLSSLLSFWSNGVMSLLVRAERCLSQPHLLIRLCSWVSS